MKILVANLGSTSFKYKLFDMPTSCILAKGSMDRIGDRETSIHSYCLGDEQELQRECDLQDHASAIDEALGCLLYQKNTLDSIEDLAAVGFKAVHARSVSGIVELDDDVVDRMEDFYSLAPAHNPAYVAAIRQFEQVAPAARLIGCFETAFHDTTPLRRQLYAVPYEWYKEYGIKRYGFHGASHRFAAEKIVEIEGKNNLHHVNMHLGGSSSVCAIKNGNSLGASHGLSPQGGLPQNNRIGDLDPFALDLVMRNQDITFSDALNVCSTQGGLLGICGHNDVRDIQDGAANGDDRCQLALEVLATSARDYLGAYVVEMGGLDVISFTGGIGEKSSLVRALILRDLEVIGVDIDEAKNNNVFGQGTLHSLSSRVSIHVVTTNEELIVARQTYDFLKKII